MPQQKPVVKAVPRPVSLAMLVLVAAAATALIVTTFARNKVYYDKVSIWASVVKSSPYKQRSHENYGFALSAVGRYEEALREFETVLSLKDGSVPMRDVYREIGVVYYRIGRYDDAILAWQKGLQFAPLDADLMTNISITYLQKRDYDAALPYALSANKSNPMRAEPLNTLGEIYLVKGENKKALDYFLRAIELDPDPPYRYWNAAVAFDKAGDHEKAARYMNVFIAKTPDERPRRDAMAFMEQLKTKIRR